MPRFARARNNGWIKTFIDGHQLEGLDRNIPHGTSWSKTPLHDIQSVRLNHDGVSIEIQGAGIYWQSDSLQVVVKVGETVKPKWAARRVCRRIDPADKFLVVRNPTKHHLVLDLKSSQPAQDFDDIKDVLVFKEEEVGQWLVVEIDVDILRPKWYVSRERV